MISKNGRPITGNPVRFRVRRPLLSNQNATSTQAQQLIRRGPAKLVNKNNETNAPAPRNALYSVQSDFSKQGRAYGAGRTNSVHDRHRVNDAAIGYSEGGYSSRRGLHSVNDGYPLRAQREAGPGSFPKAIKPRVTGQMRTNRDLFSDRVLHEAGITRL